MSEMACEIHLFTRGEGPLKTTRDLFAKAEIFLQHGVLFYGIIKEFIMQVPHGYLKEELVQLLEKVPQHYKQLKNRVRQTTFGKKTIVCSRFKYKKKSLKKFLFIFKERHKHLTKSIGSYKTSEILLI